MLIEQRFGVDLDAPVAHAFDRWLEHVRASYSRQSVDDSLRRSALYEEAILHLLALAYRDGYGQGATA